MNKTDLNKVILLFFMRKILRAGFILASHRMIEALYESTYFLGERQLMEILGGKWIPRGISTPWV